ncbi:MAG: DNA polymerase/3'-5' exonuclease PolX [Candidatus Omnitrophota bacterium]|nr:MAG: DNA polymerase/3'-5' exonuclease PolX [Candidatus Omnitrophota bacterium]HDN86209.1 DNA polymerase/3'-5' exonuclease PolX [Candidatus Omnitrophota bacterium]
MKNKLVADIFREIAKLLELKGENPFRIRAYEKASQNIESLTQDVEVFAKENKLTSLPGIGQDLANKIKEIIKTGTLTQYEKLKKEVPKGLLEMMEIPGLGPKTVKLIYEKLKIDSIGKLEEAAKSGKLRKLDGIREKTEENILKGISLLKKGRERTPLYLALKIAEGFLEPLRQMKEVEKIEVAGSVRRRKETIRDIDILIVSKNPSEVMDKFVNLSYVREVLAKGETKSSVRAGENEIQVDLRVVEKESFGSALMYFTGSKAFNIKLRQLASKDGYKINEYGVFALTKGKEKKVAGRTEEEIFKLFKMPFVAPELREDRGEVELALKNKLPKIIDRKDIKGDLHVHSKYSDGTSTIKDIALYAERMGYQYVGICDHSQGLKVAGGVSVKDVYAKIEEVRKINRQLKKVKVLCGTEVDILNDGSLDYPDSVLKEFDLVIAAIHSGFKQPQHQLTKRIVSACKNKYVHVIAHPTGRLFGVRDSYEIDFDEILKVASDYQVALELNCFPQRLDLNDINCMRARAKKVKIALGTDAHILDQMLNMDLGVSVARRGWLEKEDVLNCWSLDKLLKWLKK